MSQKVGFVVVNVRDRNTTHWFLGHLVFLHYFDIFKIFYADFATGCSEITHFN